MRLSKRNRAQESGQRRFRRGPPKSPRASHPAAAKLTVAQRDYEQLAEQHAATAEILRVIARSPADVKPAFDAIAKSAQLLLGAHSSAVARLIDGALHLQAWTTTGGRGDAALTKLFPMKVADGTATMAKAVRAGRPAYIRDTEIELASPAREMTRARGFRSVVSVPMLRDKAVIGALSVTRREPGSFSKREIGLLKTFADQAVIAIENARLFHETREMLEQQTATAGILQAISSSPTDLGPVFQTMADSCKRLLGGTSAAVVRLIDGQLHLAAFTSISPPADEELKRFYPRPLDGTSAVSIVVRTRVPYVSSDVQNDSSAPPASREVARKRGYRGHIIVPMLRHGETIGALIVSRIKAGPFPDSEISLLKTFADQAVIAIENVRLFNETKEALERQTAMSEVLRVISCTPTDAQPVFDAIAQSALRVFGVSHVGINVVQNGVIRIKATTGSRDPRGEIAIPLDRNSTAGRSVLDRAVVMVEDTEAPDVAPFTRDSGRLVGFRAVATAPMLREGTAIGSVSMMRASPGRFTHKQLELLQSFADQAVIAVENARLFNQTRESLERQTASAEILRVISSTPTDTQPVFEAIVEAIRRLVGSKYAGLIVRRDAKFAVVAYSGLKVEEIPDEVREGPLDRDKNFPSRAILDCEAVHVTDWEGEDVPEHERRVAATYGVKSGLIVPLVRKGEGIGALVALREAAGAYDEKQIGLLRSFADQAVIAIENVRLFNETKDALERQTATSEILRVISSTPTDTQPVFAAIVENARRLTSARNAVVLLRRDSDFTVAGYSAQAPAPSLDELPAEVRTAPLDREKNYPSRAILDGELVHVPDWEADDVIEFERAVAKAYGIGSGVILPLLRDGRGIGALAVTRVTKGPFHDKEIALLRSFADQAVIAIENARLFNETKEALEQQTAISEVLRVISASPTDVKPVLDAVAMRAARICAANDARLFLLEEGQLRNTAAFGEMPASIRIGDTFALDRTTVTGAAVLDSKVINVEDTTALSEGMYPGTRDTALRQGYRTIMSVPLMREQRPLGAITLRRMDARPFTEKQLALVKTFADQAAIAIENVRLFNETQEALQQQTATAEVLNVISGSITDARPVFEAISRAVLRLYGARHVALYVRQGELIDRVGYALADRAADDGSAALWPIPLDDKSLTGRAILSGELVHIKDVDAEPGLSDQSREIQRTTGVRSVLLAPMRSMGATLGALSVARRSPGGFSEREVELIGTFADQAVIAMENVRLFREIEEKSRQLETASKHKSQFLASMSHELRTPLNAILGFNEMILDGIYGELTPDVRAPLENIQSSGRHLLRLINNVLDLAKIEAGRMELALSDFSVQDTVASVHSTLKPLAAEKRLEFVAEVAADIPLARGDSGRIAQCLMNLAGNSLKFTKEGRVSIAVAQDDGLLRFSVADTGIGIPADKIPHLFTEFKQTDATIASEYGGTGLGLSITKKFIEMHGGRIWVESEPGKGSNFQFEIPLRAAP